MSTPYAALEIGTAKTVLAIAEADAGSRLKVTCHAEIPSSGIRKSQIFSIQDAKESIRSVLHAIERKQDEAGSRITLCNAFLVVSGQHVHADPYTGSAQIENGKVGADEVNEVVNAAHGMTLPNDRELLDIVEQDFAIDNFSGISNPQGMSGRVLRLNTLHIHADRNSIQNARTAADATHLEIREPLFAATCAADVVLEDYEKKNGALVIDLGGGSTGYAVYSEGYVASTGVIGVGGDHVTNDIAHAFQTTNAQAEGLKVREASAMITPAEGASARVRVEPGENTLMDTRTVSRRALDTVVNARLMELFTVIRETLEEQDLLHRLHAGVVLTGGGARMRDVDALAKQVLGANVRLGRPIHVDGLDDEEFPPAFASIAGALLYAHRNYEEKPMLPDFFRRIFK